MSEESLLLKLSERVAVLETRLTQVEDSTENNSKKLDLLLEAATMGKGAWWMLVKIGVVVSFIFTLTTTWFADVLNWIRHLIIK